MSDNEDHYSSDDNSDYNSDNESHSENIAFNENGDIVAIIPPLTNDNLNEDVADNEISVNGIDAEIIQNFPYHKKQSAKQCQICSKFYSKDMITKVDNENQCYHCIFWMNYSPETRMNVDGVYDLTIADYILKCYSSHDSESCTRNIPDYGGCFLCDFINKIPIFDIIDVEKILCCQFDNVEAPKEKTIFDDDFVIEL